VKCKEVKTRYNLAEYFKEGYASKRAILPMTTMMEESICGPYLGTIPIYMPGGT
jgi:hypothetical protein